MSDQMQITATEHGIVRLFAIDLDDDAAQTFGAAAMASGLGTDALDPAQIDVIQIEDLDELGLAGYLTLGMGIPAAEVEPMRAQLSALNGTVALVRSAAFNATATTLTPQSPVRWIASFKETPLDLSAAPLETKSSQGIIAPPAPKAARSNTTVLLWVLAIFAVILLVTLSMFIRIAA